MRTTAWAALTNSTVRLETPKAHQARPKTPTPNWSASKIGRRKSPGWAASAKAQGLPMARATAPACRGAQT